MTIQTFSPIPTAFKNGIVSCSLIRERNLLKEITNFIGDLWKTTRSRYISVLRQWFVYATSQNTDRYTAPDVNTVLPFIADVKINCYLYGGLCAAPSVVSSIVIIKN